ncbi:MAG: hypothetical protein GKR93_11145 [Gammaproteobacteria bacterium]|nr:hypothetical protein [Gammaproteobacteria bacterium]
MHGRLICLSIICSVLLLSGCETTTSRPYSESTDNVLKFQSILGKADIKVHLGGFSENPEIGELTCRLMGPVDVASGKSKAEYIKEAMQKELFLAQVYAVDSEVEITGLLDSATFSSVSPAFWELGFTISSDKSEGFSITTKYPFKTSYSAYSACQNVADAFGPAVQQLIDNIVSHPEFGRLVGI